MSTLSIRIPDSLHDSLKRVSRKDSISINQFVAAAVAEKVTALETETYLKTRAARGTKSRFSEILRKVPDVKAEPEAESSN